MISHTIPFSFTQNAEIACALSIPILLYPFCIATVLKTI